MSQQLTRRRFIHSAVLASAAIAAHGALAQSGRPHSASAASAARFRKLRLKTRGDLEAMAAFYSQTLGLPLNAATNTTLSVQIGASTLVYERIADGEHADMPDPWYHVAFNISENKIVPARDWLLERVELDNNPNAERHPDHDDIVAFNNWDAHSCFFRDPAGNLLELIARHTLDNAARGPFTPRDMHCCSEIALVFNDEDIGPSADALTKVTGLDRYQNSSPRFAALGDEQGLLLVMRRGVSMRGQADVFPTSVELAGVGQLDHQTPGFPYSLSAAPAGRP